MGDRRMMSKTVTQTQRFLQLPLETQALYFHLLQSTDDDGIVEAYPIVRMINASEDSLKLLIVKEFIIPLNDEMVYFVIHFSEQNTVRADRKKDSKYIDLLRKQLPNVEITASRQRVDREPKGTGQPWDNHGTTIGQQNIIQYKLSKDNLNKTLLADAAAVETAKSEKKPSLTNQFKQEFEALWKLYPKKARKADAQKAYVKARKAGTSVEDVRSGIDAYNEYLKASHTESRFIAQGGTWFNQQRWLDTYDIPNYKQTAVEQEQAHFDDWDNYLNNESINVDDLPF